MLNCTITLKVRYVETDKMGVVHHSNYFAWFEMARVELIEKAGYTYAQLEKEGIMLPLLNASCDYIFPAYFDDILDITIYIKEIKGVKITFRYEISKHGGDGTIITKGQTTHAWTNSNLRPINIKKVNPELYNKFIEICEK